jgi:uncharacterized protein (DUF1015 family)
VVEDGRLGRLRRLPVVVAADGVEELGEDSGLEVSRAVLDHPQPEVDVAEQAPFLRLAERRSRPELAHPPDVVHKRGREEQVAAQARVELGGLPRERRHPNRVLEEPARVAMVPVGAGGRKRAERRADLRVADERADELREARVRDLVGEELEEPVELLRVSPERRRQLRRVGVLGCLDSADLHLQPPAEALDASEHADGITFREALVEEVDVAPDASLDAPTRVGELEREVRRAGPSPPSLLPRHREHALHGPVLGELGDRGHGSGVYGQIAYRVLRPRSGRLPGIFRAPRFLRKALVRSPAMADVQPFRAVRYTGAAGRLADLVAPPYDAVSDEERTRLAARSPFNVVHLTLPDAADEARRLYDEWLASGVLDTEPDASVWLLVEEFVGPDAVARERRGIVASVAAEPFARGGILPHERTHPHVREDRARLLRATRVQPEPVLLLHEGSPAAATPDREPDLRVDGSRLWKIDADLEPLAREELLVADGHHRYESALELGRELDAGARIMALLVSTRDPGVHVFPTHRVFSGRPDLRAPQAGVSCASLDDALVRLQGEGDDRSVAIAYRKDAVELVRGDAGELDVELVDRHGLQGIAYTPQLADAVAAVDRGEADVAFLLREPRVEDVFAVARRGMRMPQKSTYFFPKPLAGLLFHPVS